MAIPFGNMMRRKMAWGKLGSKLKRRLTGAVRNAAYYGITRAVRREITVMAAQMNIPANRLREHFNGLLKKGIRKRELGDKMVQDLTEIRELRKSTKVAPARWKKFVSENSLDAALNEMREHAQAQQQQEQAQAQQAPEQGQRLRKAA